MKKKIEKIFTATIVDNITTKGFPLYIKGISKKNFGFLPSSDRNILVVNSKNQFSWKRVFSKFGEKINFFRMKIFEKKIKNQEKFSWKNFKRKKFSKGFSWKKAFFNFRKFFRYYIFEIIFSKIIKKKNFRNFLRKGFVKSFERLSRKKRTFIFYEWCFSRYISVKFFEIRDSWEFRKN